MLDFLGYEKFDNLFKSRVSKLRPGPYVSHSISQGSLCNYLEYISPNLKEPTDLASLKVGDHIFIHGVPEHNYKHPLSALGNFHGIVMGRNQEQEVLVGALGFDQAKTISEVVQLMLDAYNKPQSESTKTNYRNYSNVMAAGSLTYTLEEAKKIGAGAIENYETCRLSPFILSALKDADASEPLDLIAWEKKALLMADQLLGQITPSE
jgi:hypothetical protein